MFIMTLCKINKYLSFLTSNLYLVDVSSYQINCFVLVDI